VRYLLPEDNTDVYFFEDKLDSFFCYYDYDNDDILPCENIKDIPENEKCIELLRYYNKGKEIENYYLIFYDYEHKPKSIAYHVLEVNDAIYLNHDTNEANEKEKIVQQCIKIITEVMYECICYNKEITNVITKFQPNINSLMK